MRLRSSQSTATKGNVEVHQVRQQRAWRVRRGFIVTFLVMLAGFALVIQEIWIRADGLVVGNVTSVEPLFRARVRAVLSACDQPVAAGQPLLELENELIAVQFNETLNRLEDRAIRSRAELEIQAEQVAAAKEDHNASLAILAEKASLWQVHDRLFQKQVITRTAWTSARSAWKRAEAESFAAEARWRARQAEYDRAEKELLASLGSFSAEEISGIRDSSIDGRTLVLRAPKSGLLTQCEVNPGEIVDAGKPIFQIFHPSDAYIEAYFSPDDVEELTRDKVFTVRLTGIDTPFRGRIETVQAVVSELPPQLIRYFWQRAQWSQYQPARISLRNAPPELLSRVRSDARADVSVFLWPDWVVDLWNTLAVPIGLPPADRASQPVEQQAYRPN